MTRIIMVLSLAPLLMILPSAAQAREMAAKRLPLNLSLYCRGYYEGQAAAPRDPRDPNSWRCGPTEAINNTRACQSMYGSQFASGARNANDAQSIYCYNIDELQRVRQAFRLGRRMAAYIIRTQPRSKYVPRLSGKSTNNLLLQGVANSITAYENRAANPRAPEIPDLSSADGPGAIALEVHNWERRQRGEEELESLENTDLSDRFFRTVGEFLGGRTWSEAWRNNFNDFATLYDAARSARSTPPQPVQPSTTPHVDRDGPEGRDPNDRIGINARDEMEARVTEEGHGRSENLHDTARDIERVAREQADRERGDDDDPDLSLDPD